METLTVKEANRLSREEFVERFGSLYEHSPWVAEGAWQKRPFESFEELHAAFGETMYQAPEEKQLDLIRAHPDLAGKAAVAGELTEESSREQSSAGLNRLSEEEFERFTEMNEAYHEKFGLPFVVCVREHTKESILKNAEARLSNGREEEIRAALGEIHKIAGLRLRDMTEGGER